MSRRNPQVLPQSSMIFAISNTIQEISPREEDVEECENEMEMETFPNNSRIINVQPFQPYQISNETEHQHENENEIHIDNEIIADQLPTNPSIVANSQTFEQNNPPRLQINNWKYNKNLMNFTGVLIFVIMFKIMIIFLVGTRYFS